LLPQPHLRVRTMRYAIGCELVRICAIPTALHCNRELAERVGFEPTVSSRPRRISSAVLSTSQPPLRRGNGGTSPPRFGSRGPLADEWRLAKPLASICTGTKLHGMSQTPATPATDPATPITARFNVGEVVRHRMFDFRGVIFDVDPSFNNSDEWYEAIPAEIRPRKDQPFYHLLAENEESSYVAYVSQQNLVGDGNAGPVGHPGVKDMFDGFDGRRYRLRSTYRH
jgi:heat shock protein HspQ